MKRLEMKIEKLYYTTGTRKSYKILIPKKKPKLEPEENRFMFRFLLLNGLNLITVV